MKRSTAAHLDDTSYFKYTLKSQLDKYIHTLEGIIKGIAIDGKLNQKEIKELEAWCNDYVNIANRHPFNELIPILKNALKDSRLETEEIKDILWLCKNLRTDNEYYDIITSDIQRLQGILHGILADNVITPEELRKLNRWIDENADLKGIYPYDEIESINTKVLQDGNIDPEEHNFLTVFFSEFIIFPRNSNIDQNHLKKLKQEITIPGICALCPEISFDGSLFCFTGISSKAKRSEIAEIVESFGGLYIDNVREDTKYLIIGNNGNPCWASGMS